MEMKLQFAAQLAVAVIFRQQLQPPCKLITHFNTTENLHIPPRPTTTFLFGCQTNTPVTFSNEL